MYHDDDLGPLQGGAEHDYAGSEFVNKNPFEADIASVSRSFQNEAAIESTSDVANLRRLNGILDRLAEVLAYTELEVDLVVRMAQIVPEAVTPDYSGSLVGHTGYSSVILPDYVNAGKVGEYLEKHEEALEAAIAELDDPVGEADDYDIDDEDDVVIDYDDDYDD